MSHWLHGCCIFHVPLLSYFTKGSAVAPTAAVGHVEPNEPPPPYTASNPGSVVHQINCKVCQAPLNIAGQQQLQVIKCGTCHEATVSRHQHPNLILKVAKSNNKIVKDFRCEHSFLIQFCGLFVYLLVFNINNKTNLDAQF